MAGISFARTSSCSQWARNSPTASRSAERIVEEGPFWAASSIRPSQRPRSSWLAGKATETIAPWPVSFEISWLRRAASLAASSSDRPPLM